MKKLPSICTIGGGSGMPIVNHALVEAGFDNINSIVTTFDSGGDSGRMRTDERGKILAFSDYWRSLISLWDDGKQKENWVEMLRFRDGRGRNFGNIFFQFMAEKSGNLSEVDRLFSKLTSANVKGQVIPVSNYPADICFSTISGKIYQGEHNLDSLRMSKDVVSRIWLLPEVKANPEAITALLEAHLIIFCPGSMYGSVITNLLPVGMMEAFKQSKAKKLLMTNLMSVSNENDGFNQNDYVNTISNYLEIENPFDTVLMADMDALDKVEMGKILDNYLLENSKPIQFADESAGFKTIVADIATIELENLRLRHSVSKLANFFQSFVRMENSYVAEKNQEKAGRREDY